MKRRNFVRSSAAAMLASQAAAEGAGPQIFRLQYYYMRNGPQVDRSTQYLGAVLPATRHAGALQAGLFSPVIGERSPFILAITSYASLGALEAADAKLAEDKEFSKAWDGYNNIADPAYIRIETVLLRGFDRIPSLDPPPTDASRAPRIFELRTYESVNERASRRKIKMFEDGEAAIFRRIGMTPVFFGSGLTGSTLPSLTYMLAFDDLAAREKLWRTFASDPEWLKLRAQPGLSDAEIVSNISSAILRPLANSPIR